MYRPEKNVRRVPHHPGEAITQILPHPADGVEVVYTRDPVEGEAWLKNNVIDKDASAVGFDIEWKPQFKKKTDGGVEHQTAVLQLAVENSCLVLHIHHMITLPKLLRKVLQDKAIKKVGSGILQDIVKLRRDKGVKCEGRADTQIMAQRLGVGRSDGLGLKKLCERFLGIELNKNMMVTMSNWEKFPLSHSQIEYAAMDAWIGLRLFNYMKQLADDRGIYVEDPDGSQEEGHHPTMCGTCGKTFAKGKALHNHMKIHINSSDDGLKRVEDSTKLVICEGCGKKCKGEGSLAEHQVKAAHTRCPRCGKMFPKVVPKKHRKSCANIICKGCGKKCEGEADLAQHILHAAGHVRCQSCQKIFMHTVPRGHIIMCPLFSMWSVKKPLMK